MTNPPITEMNSQIPLLLRLSENALRSGYNILQSLDMAAREVSEPVAQDIRVVLADVEAGTPLPDALAGWVQRTPSPDLDLMIAVMKVQFEVGGNLADKFNLLSQLLENRTLNPT